MILSNATPERQEANTHDVHNARRTRGNGKNPFLAVLNGERITLNGLGTARTLPPGVNGRLGGEQSRDRWAGNVFSSIPEAFKVLGRFDEIVPGWVPATGASMLVAEKGTGKTLDLVDLGLCLATDQDTWKGFPVASGWFVVFLCGEFEALTLQHAIAWCKHHKVEPDLQRFIFVSLAPNLLDRQDVTALIPHIRAVVPEGAKIIAFIDTLQRAMVGADLNSSKEASVAVENLEYLQRVLAAPVVLAAHPPKSGGDDPLGSSVFGNITGAMWEMHCIGDNGRRVSPKANPTATRLVQVTRYKGAPANRHFYAKIVGVPVGGEDSYGKPYTGGVLVLEQGSAMRDADFVPSPDQEALLELLHARPELRGQSNGVLARELGWFYGPEQQPHKEKVRRQLEALAKVGLIEAASQANTGRH